MSQDRLISEIREQPSVLDGLLRSGRSAVQALAEEVLRRQIAHVVIVARGTSDHSATYAKYQLGIAHGLSVSLAAPSITTLYDASLRLTPDTLVLGISQSGMSPDIVAVVAEARKQGVLTAALVNSTESRLAGVAEWVVPLGAGPEQSVAATKSYTAQLMALAMLSALLDQDSDRLAQLAAVPEAVRRALDLEEGIARRAERYRYMEHCAVISRGYNYPTALEIALKLKELTYTATTAYSAADFLHGPVAVVREGYPIAVVACQGRASRSLQAIFRATDERGAELITITDDEQLAQESAFGLFLPQTLPEWLSPIVAVIPGQLLAYHLARARGIDPEKPRGLAKVTETR